MFSEKSIQIVYVVCMFHRIDAYPILIYASLIQVFLFSFDAHMHDSKTVYLPSLAPSEVFI